MDIVIGTHALGLGGSETYAITLADHLQRLGQVDGVVALDDQSRDGSRAFVDGEWQQIGYDYLVDDSGIELVQIESDRCYGPLHRESR